jgi:hypothetical protein
MLLGFRDIPEVKFLCRSYSIQEIFVMQPVFSYCFSDFCNVHNVFMTLHEIYSHVWALRWMSL